MTISVIIPTIQGREEWLARCISGYSQTVPSDAGLELIVEHDHPTCGAGWNAGAQKADTDYLHFTCDDIVPTMGWYQAAVECIERGGTPSPTVYGAGGDLQFCGTHTPGQDDRQWNPDWHETDFTSLLTFSREQWERVEPTAQVLASLHYFSDDYLSWRARLAGIPIYVRHDYRFTHYWAGPGRIHEMDPDRIRFFAEKARWEDTASSLP